MIKPKGILIAIGGNEDKGAPENAGPPSISHKGLEQELEVLTRVLTEIKGCETHIEVITAASSIPEEVGQNYLNAFTKLGCLDIGIMHIRNRLEARNKEFEERIRKADGVMFSGGDQLRLATVLGGTEILKIIEERYLNENFVIAGTSAGAMAMGDIMIYQKDPAEKYIDSDIKFAPGFGFIQDVLIDTHFIERGRFMRLARSVAHNATYLGVGLAEDTGIVIRNGCDMEIIGSGIVMIIEGEDIHTSYIGAQTLEGSHIAIENMQVHALTRGCHYTIGGETKIPGLNGITKTVETEPLKS